MRVLESQGSTDTDAPELTIGDLFASTIGLVAGVVFVATMRGWDWPFLGSYRSAVAVLALVGLGMCVAGGMQVRSFGGPLVTAATFLGFVAMAFTIAGLVTGTKVMFVALAATMLVL